MSTNLHDLEHLVLYGVILWLPIFVIINAIVPQEELSLLLLANGQQDQEQNNTNTTTTDMTNLRSTIIPQAQEVNEANSELIKLCVSAPNSECDGTMVIIHNDCVAYPEFVATHIPSCDDSRLMSYLIARGLLEQR
jgi:hypothetical protein